MPTNIPGDLIEGSGDPDYLEGGDGNDTLIGYGGNDTLIGGEGSDTFVFGDGFDHDLILDFTPGKDRLEFRSDEIQTWDDVLERLSADEDGNALITLGDGSTLSLIGVSPDDLNQDDVYIGDDPIPCFTPGTLIRTARGLVPIEALRIGDLVVTLDKGLVPLRWIGRRDLSAQYLRHSPDLWPVCIEAGALGYGHPVRDLMVSPEHRVVVAGPVVQLCAGKYEVLVAAKDLVGQPGITQVMPEGVSYIHIMFDAHHIIDSDGAWTESFQPSNLTINAIDRAARTEILTLFPELALAKGRRGFASARPVLAAHETRCLLTMLQSLTQSNIMPQDSTRAAA